MGEEVARIMDQVVLWFLGDAAPWLTRAASVLWQNHTALLAVIGIILLYIRTRASDQQAKAAIAQARVANVQAKTAEQGHITDRFTKAIEQLGSEKMAVRLGAIYALERLSRDSQEDHWTIMEVLTAYVRDNAPWPPKRASGNPFVELQARDADVVVAADEGPEQADGQEKMRPSTDIQASLTVLGRRHRWDKAAVRRLDLMRTDLRGADLFLPRLEGARLVRACLDGAKLIGARLDGADLSEAHLDGANLLGTHLDRADLSMAHLNGAKLIAVHLDGANLLGAHLDRADFMGASLDGADLLAAHLNGADLSQVRVLAQEQLDVTFGDEHTILPDGFTRPARWLNPDPSPATPPFSPPPSPEA